MPTPTVVFSELSKNSKRVADIVDRAQRIHIARRDGEDLFLTTERYDRQREETAAVTARLFAALSGTDEGAQAIRQALPAVFPWARHLSADDARGFTRDLVNAVWDVSELDVHANLHQTIVDWRDTARNLAEGDAS